MKYSLIISTLLFSTSFTTYAQTQVIKCVDDSGNVTYNNQKVKGKGMVCTDTNLGTIDQLKTAPANRSNIVRNSNSTANNGINSETNITPQDQAFRDLKRKEILISEMNQEKKQLELVKDMLSKVNKTDEVQVKQLNSMLQSHQNNINTLEKDLSVTPTDFSGVVSSVIPGLGIPKTKDNAKSVEFKIEGSTVLTPPTTIGSSNNLVVQKPTPIKMPDLDGMRSKLDSLKKERENKEDVDKSQHIEIKRRLPGVNISQNSLNYVPLPTPLSVPDLGIGR